MIKLFLLVALGLGLFALRQRFILVIPLLPMVSTLFYFSFDQIVPQDYWFLFCGYELLMVGLVGFPHFEKTDRLAVCIAILPFFAVHGLFFSSVDVGQKWFIFLGLFLSSGVYLHFKEKMIEILRKGTVEHAIAIMVFINLFYKLYYGIRGGESFLLERGGGVWGSNHLAGMLLLLMPMIQSSAMTAVVVGVLVIQLSRGIWLALAIYGVCWVFLVDWKRGIAVCVAVAIGFSLFFWQLSFVKLTSQQWHTADFSEYMSLRLGLNSDKGGDWVGGILDNFLRDPRFDYFVAAVALAEHSQFLGSGFGGIRGLFSELGIPLTVTSLHNMYLTVCVDGGIIFVSFFLGFLFYLLCISWKFERKAFAGLFTWMCYCLYSGEIYLSGGLPTCVDYYLLMFLAAYVVVRRGEQQYRIKVV